MKKGIFITRTIPITASKRIGKRERTRIYLEERGQLKPWCSSDSSRHSPAADVQPTAMPEVPQPDLKGRGAIVTGGGSGIPLQSSSVTDC